MSDKELFENAKMVKDAFVEQQRQSVLQMDLMDFLEDNITEKSLRTRMVNWIYRYNEIRTVGALVKWCEDYKYAHPILAFRYIGRDCENAIIDALGKYGIDINKKETINKQTSTNMNEKNSFAIVTAIIFAALHDKQTEKQPYQYGVQDEITKCARFANMIFETIEDYDH